MTKITVWVRKFNDAEWTHYGDCTEAELRSEMVNIRAGGLYVATGKKPSK